MGGEGRCYMVVVVVGLSVLVVSSWWLEGVVAAVVRVEIEFKSDFPAPTTVFVFRMPLGFVVGNVESLYSKGHEWHHLQSVDFVQGGVKSKREVWQFEEDAPYYIIYEPRHSNSLPVFGSVRFHGGDGTKKWLCQGSSKGGVTIQEKFNEEEKDGKRD